MQNNLAELERPVSELKKVRELLMHLWSGVMPFFSSEQQFNLWLEVHTPRTMQIAIAKTRPKYQKLAGAMDDTYAVKFVSSVANTITNQHNGEE